MKVLIREKISPHIFKTPEGYLICQDSILARTGKQTYRKNELFLDTDDDSEIEVDRPYDEVFSKETLASFENKPITIEHPEEDITIDNYKDYAVGFARDIRQAKGENGEDIMIGNLVITDKDAIEKIESGEMKELSCGYDCDITDDASPKQTHIRGNHIALCERGRAGISKIVDSKKTKDWDLSSMANSGIEYKGYLIVQYAGKYVGIDKKAGVIDIDGDSIDECKKAIDRTREWESRQKDSVKDKLYEIEYTYDRETEDGVYERGKKGVLKSVSADENTALEKAKKWAEEIKNYPHGDGRYNHRDFRVINKDSVKDADVKEGDIIKHTSLPNGYDTRTEQYTGIDEDTFKVLKVEGDTIYAKHLKSNETYTINKNQLSNRGWSVVKDSVKDAVEKQDIWFNPRAWDEAYWYLQKAEDWCDQDRNERGEFYWEQYGNRNRKGYFTMKEVRFTGTKEQIAKFYQQFPEFKSKVYKKGTPFIDSVKDAHYTNINKKLSKDDAIRELKNVQLDRHGNWDAGFSGDDWYLLIQTLETNEIMGRMWHNGWHEFKAVGQLNDVINKMISYLTSVHDSINDAQYKIKLEKKVNDYDEYVVEVFTNGKHDEMKTAYTDDWDDAVGTLKQMANQMGLNVRQVGRGYVADSIKDAVSPYDKDIQRLLEISKQRPLTKEEKEDLELLEKSKDNWAYHKEVYESGAYAVDSIKDSDRLKKLNYRLDEIGRLLYKYEQMEMSGSLTPKEEKEVNELRKEMETINKSIKSYNEYFGDSIKDGYEITGSRQDVLSRWSKWEFGTDFSDLILYSYDKGGERGLKEYLEQEGIERWYDEIMEIIRTKKALIRDSIKDAKKLYVVRMTNVSKKDEQELGIKGLVVPYEFYAESEEDAKRQAKQFDRNKRIVSVELKDSNKLFKVNGTFVSAKHHIDAVRKYKDSKVKDMSLREYLPQLEKIAREGESYKDRYNEYLQIANKYQGYNNARQLEQENPQKYEMLQSQKQKWKETSDKLARKWDEIIGFMNRNGQWYGNNFKTLSGGVSGISKIPTMQDYDEVVARVKSLEQTKGETPYKRDSIKDSTYSSGNIIQKINGIDVINVINNGKFEDYFMIGKNGQTLTDKKFYSLDEIKDYIYHNLRDSIKDSVNEGDIQRYCDLLNQTAKKEGYGFLSFTYKKGAKYYKIIENSSGESVHAFVDYEGNVYKASGWNAVAKGVRCTLDQILSGAVKVDTSTGYLYNYR